MNRNNDGIVVENEEILLREPTVADEKIIMEFKREFEECGSYFAGESGLRDFDKFEDWFDKVERNKREGTCQEGRVPAFQYLTIRKADGVLVGMINFRPRLNEFLLKFGGHIGDCVRPTERRRGYATKQIFLVLEIAKKLGLERVLLTCKKSNVASAKSIIKNGGVLENEVDKEGEVMQRYWIEL